MYPVDPDLDPEHCSNRERIHSGVRPGKLDCKSVPPGVDEKLREKARLQPFWLFVAESCI